MPAAFEKCVSDGGRVRTKSLPDNKFIHICFLNGKSYAGEIRTAKESKEERERLESMGTRFDEEFILNTSILEKEIDEKKSTVVAGVLQEDSLSANGRFYPAHIVRESIAKLSGKRSLIGHDTDNVIDIVAKITNSYMKNGIGFAEFKFGSDDRSQSVFSRIKEGLVDSTSIRASGSTKRGKINDQMVDVVESLDINSVDWVLEGGVSAAKVVKVFESKPEIVFEPIKEVKKMDEKELQALKDRLAESETKLKSLEESEAKAKLEAEESKKKIAEAELNAYKQEKLAKVKSDDLREYLKDSISGASKEEIEKSFAKHIAFFEKFSKENKLKEEVVIKATDTQTVEKPKSINQLLNSNLITEEEKVKVLLDVLGGK